ncbi:MAG TPA: autoinducer binding domain-containing protein [Roseateles sp.]|uniref:autoinducer binding domain-containing protein n=1 Tax=Roseateles sp. TaxID=1971397 RepID=UPI002EDB4127
MTAQAVLQDASTDAARILALLPGIRRAATPEQALELLCQVVRMIGAGSGVFLSAIKDDASRSSIRSLLACDPQWVVEYSRIDWHDGDPWLRHALENQTPINGSEISVRPSEEAFIQRSSALGFASSIIVPAPTSLGAARFGVLILGSSQPGHFDREDQGLIQIVARALAMEIHEWLLQAARENLLERSRLTPVEIDLLRHEAAGHTSKMIAAASNVKSQTVDCWFQRVNAKLNAPDRRTAMRVARLYGVI